MDQEPEKQPEETLPVDSVDPKIPQPAAPPANVAAQTSESLATPLKPVESPEVAPTAATTSAPSDADRPNQLAALLIAAVFGIFGIHQLYIGNKTQGYVRLALAVLPIPLLLLLIVVTATTSSVPATLIFLVGALFSLFLPILAIWAFVDFVRIGFGSAKDNHGRGMLASKQDANWARALTITGIVMLVLYLLLFILSSSLGVMNAFDSIENDAQEQYQYEIDPSVIGPTPGDI